jgi:hypothetical protein
VKSIRFNVKVAKSAVACENGVLLFEAVLSTPRDVDLQQKSVAVERSQAAAFPLQRANQFGTVAHWRVMTYLYTFRHHVVYSNMYTTTTLKTVDKIL